MSGGAIHPKYRPDIDGLRAVAVLAVVAFHAFPEHLRGGFVGVDVFFVISGFLISSIIFGGLEQGCFSFADFYARRIRRIFPALILVLVATFAFGWFALIAYEYKQLGKHIFGGAAFAANILFWYESGYFDVAAELKPLLHLWSLGIEEQFYIVWPLALFILHRRRLDPLHAIIAIVVLSFALNVVAAAEDSVKAFYAPQTRFWELLLGSALAYLKLYRQPAAAHPWPAPDLRAFAGLGLIAAAILFLDRDKAFPGWWGLLPTLGALLTISAGPQAWLNRRLLAHPALVFVGLISYPLYLWHWPLLSYARIIEAGTPSAGLRLALVVAAVVLAALTYRLLERPIRASQRKALAVGLFLVCAVVGALGYNTYRRDGLGFRMKHFAQVQGDVADFDGYRARYAPCAAPGAAALSWCLASKPGPVNYAIFGDSHADHLFPGIAESDPEHNWLLVGQSACPPLADMAVHKAGERDVCRERNRAALDYLLQDKSISRVLLASLGPFYISDTPFAPAHRGRSDPKNWTIAGAAGGDRRQMFYDGLAATVRALQAAGKRVDLYVDVPELPFKPADCLVQRPFSTRQVQCRVERATVLERQRPYREILTRLQADIPGVGIFDPLDQLCGASFCEIRQGDVLYYRDSHHLSLRGSAVLGKSFVAWWSAPPGAPSARRVAAAGP